MIVIYGGLRVRAEKVAEIATLARPFVAEVLKEAGCIAYELSWDATDPQNLRLLEHWQDEAHYLAHRKQRHVAEWAAAVTAAQETPLAVTRLNATLR